MSLSLSDLKYVEVLGEDRKNEYKSIIEKKGLKTVYVAGCENCMVANGAQEDSKKKEEGIVNLEKLISTLDLSKSDDSLKSQPEVVNEKKEEDNKKESVDHTSKHITFMNESQKTAPVEKKLKDNCKIISEDLDVKHGLEVDESSKEQELYSAPISKKEDKAKIKMNSKSESIVESGLLPKDTKRVFEEKRGKNEKEINWRFKESSERKVSESNSSKSFQDGGYKKYLNKDRSKFTFKRDHGSFKNRTMTNSTVEENENVQKKNIVYGWKVKKYKDGNVLFDAIKSKFTYSFDNNLSWGPKDGNSCYETGKSLYLNTFRRNRSNQKY